MDDFSSLSQFAMNLRWMMRAKDSDPSRWAGELTKLSRFFFKDDRSWAMLLGQKAEPADVAVIAEQSGRDVEELQSVPLYGGKDQIRRENLRCLLDALPQGQSKVVAKKLGVSESQVSRWKSGTGIPRIKNIRNLLKLHGIDPDIDLEKIPLFLSIEPVSAYTQKQWVLDRIQDMPSDEVAKIFPALRRIVRYNEKN
jgi:transcriptional regulator with XRE-family HTH domain